MLSDRDKIPDTRRGKKRREEEKKTFAVLNKDTFLLSSFNIDLVRSEWIERNSLIC